MNNLSALRKIGLISFLLLISCNKDDIHSEIVNQSCPLSDEALNPAVTVYLEDAFYNDYVLVTPQSASTTYLMNRQGNMVHSWDREGDSAFMAYLVDDGSIIRSCFSGEDNGINIGGKTGILQRIDKDGNLLWQWELITTSEVLHHDIALLPNGNILASVWEVKDRTQSIEAGRNLNQLVDDRIIIDKVIEIRPVGSNDAEIVWEWSLWDHLVQEIDAIKQNYGIVSESPQLVDINYTDGRENFTHINGLDYIAEFDQIVLNSRILGEFLIIDHSTTVAQAASHEGGRYDKGGDILFRFGNETVVSGGGDPVFEGQHDTTYIGDYNNSSGDFLTFNNLEEAGVSAVYEVSVDQVNGNYSSVLGTTQNTVVEWKYSSADIFSARRSGAWRLPNGNTLITPSSANIIREVNPNSEVVWEYDINLEQEDFLNLELSSFKARSYDCGFSGISVLEIN